jgi:YegS/Rv2252/BmrU family lipid kinase
MQRRFRKIRVVVNPAAGNDEAVLATLNAAFAESGADWEVSVTHQAGDATRLARKAAREGADLVAAYGGDGTVMEVVAGLVGADVPVGILPGGTANVLAADLGIPPALADAAALLVGDHGMRPLDVGTSSRRHFVLRLSAGLEAEMDIGATRERKDALGILAYPLSALEAARDATPARYRLTIDGKRHEIEGVTCIVANSGGFTGGFRLAPDIDVSDGLLDVIVLQQADVRTTLGVAADVLTGKAPDDRPLERWKARTVKVEADPPQHVVNDGEPAGETPFTARVTPAAVQVVVPLPPAEEDGDREAR